MKNQDDAMAAASSAVEAHEEEEEFSFHRVNTGPLVHCSIDSPPLWHLSPAKEEEIDRDEEDHHHHLESKAVTNCSRRKSFSCIEGRRCRKMAEEEEDEDENEDQKMDLLWENFNEELRKSRLLESDSKSPPHNDDDQIARMGSCVQALKLPKKMNSTSQLISRTRKPGGGGGGGGSLVIINFLKKLFLLHHSSRKLKITRSL